MKIPAMAATLSGLLLIALPSFGQITTIEGVVTGLDGKPLQGAVISISRTDVRTKKPATVKTDKKGHFIDNLIMGTYDVTCLVDDKEADHQNNVKTSPTASKMVNFDLRQAAAQAAAIQKAAQNGGNLSKDQERSMSPEQKKALEEYYAKQKENIKKNAALNEAFNAGKTAMDSKQYDAAIESFNKAADLDPRQGAVWASLAQAYEALAKTKTGADFDTNMQKAADTWVKAIALNPDDAGLHNNYALTLAGGKKFPEAQAELEKAATINPAGAGQYYYNLGALEVNSNQNDAASEAFKKAIGITPPYAEAFYQYGLTLMAKATFDKDGKTIPVPGTAEAFQKYLELTPDGPHAEDAKAMLASLGATVETQYKNPDAGKKKKK
ncbi:MAG: carboxypeptidase regulatory-like domain-containing protein [Bryobacteraceae bacterium]|jgi:tetratricopeptide (TPR) repeat protein